MYFQAIDEARRALRHAWPWPNFRIEEFACRCGGRFCRRGVYIDPILIARLQTLRTQLGRPLIVTSGHRCAQWNAAIGGAPRSRHKQLAVDLSVQGHDRDVLHMTARAVGFSGIGLGQRFIHLDARAKPATWVYTGSAALWKM
jgi:zinc D-Ala-D-Ala carboxypeptidase